MKTKNVAMFALLLVAGLAGCTQTETARPTPTPPATSAPTATTTASPTETGTSPPSTTPSPPPTLPHLGRAGFGALHLGMTKQEAAATGSTVGINTSTPGQCGGIGDGYLSGSQNPNGQHLEGRLFFGSTGRLVAIYAFAGVTTPEGIGLNSSYASVHATYPTWQALENRTNGRGAAPVHGNSAAHYRIVILNHKVVELSMDSNHQDCYE
jgi:hypothetical protein